MSATMGSGSDSVAAAVRVQADAPRDQRQPEGRGELRLLPRSPVAQIAVWLLAGMAATLVFGAWLSPNMVFDFADMVFCN